MSILLLEEDHYLMPDAIDILRKLEKKLVKFTESY